MCMHEATRRRTRRAAARDAPPHITRCRMPRCAATDLGGCPSVGDTTHQLSPRSSNAISLSLSMKRLPWMRLCRPPPMSTPVVALRIVFP